MKIKLWKKNIPLPKGYDEIKRALSSAIIEKMYPHAHDEMKKGAVYSHYGLTTVFESVDYAFEYLAKENLLRERVIKHGGKE